MPEKETGTIATENVAKTLAESARLSIGSCVLSALTILIVIWSLYFQGSLPRLMLVAYPPLLLWAAIAGGYAFMKVHRCARLVRNELLDKTFHDEATGLFNTRYLEERLKSEYERVTRYGGTVVILYIDLDRFKAVNDRFGHPAGNVVLREVAAAMKGQIRASDALGRAGGDEFMAVLQQATAERARPVAERLCKAVEELSCDIGNGRKVDFVRASIGIAEFPAHGDSMESVVSAADRAVYEAKKLGGNSVSVFTGSAEKADGE